MAGGRNVRTSVRQRVMRGASLGVDEDAVGLINLENRSAITELSVRLDRAGAVRRLENIATARRRLNGNGNPVLVFEALFCALIP